MDKNFPRLLQTLRLIPRQRKASTVEIHDRLAAHGFSVSVRTVQRDLEALSTAYDILCDRRDKPFGWQWAKSAHSPVLASMELPQALALNLMEREFNALLPEVAKEQIKPWFEQAEHVLSKHSDALASRWVQKIAICPQGLPLLPAKVQPAVLGSISQALFAQLQVKAKYRSAGESEARDVSLHPLGLIKTGLVDYLVACFVGFDDPRLLALHRISHVKISNGRAVIPENFDLQDYIQQGGLSFGGNGDVRLRFKITNAAASHLLDTPLAKDQTIKAARERGWSTVQATVKDSPKLHWWLRGFGDQVKVMEPKKWNC